MATVNLGSIKFKWKGTYSGATAYTVDDVVEYNGSSYICILASTGNLPTNATYFEQMSSAGTNGTGTDLTTTLTTQGDLVYRDGSGLQRLGAGTSGQALLTQGTGANPIWGDAGGGVLQTVFTTTSTTFASSSDSYVATPLTITITPTSSSSKIVLFMRTHINVTGDSYPRFKWYRSIGGGSFTSIITEPTNPNGGASLGTYLGDRANATNVHQMNVMSDVYQDFPNTTSAVTYTLYGVRENGGTFYINTSEYQEAGNTQDFNQVGISTILAMETGV
jgi:hypothetical protein